MTTADEETLAISAGSGIAFGTAVDGGDASAEKTSSGGCSQTNTSEGLSNADESDQEHDYCELEDDVYSLVALYDATSPCSRILLSGV